MTSVTARLLAAPTMHTHGLRPRPARTAEIDAGIPATGPSQASQNPVTSSGQRKHSNSRQYARRDCVLAERLPLGKADLCAGPQPTGTAPDGRPGGGAWP